jgi:hypothetical protein
VTTEGADASRARERGAAEREGGAYAAVHNRTRGSLKQYLQVDWEASPRWAGASGLFCQWTAIWRVAARLRTHHLRARPRGLFRCGSIILSSQTADKSRRLGRLSHRQSAPRMWSSTLQRSVRLGCRTALSKLRGMTSRPVSGRPTVARCPPAGDRACRRLCYCHFN